MVSTKNAQMQAPLLAREIGCPSTTNEELMSCLRDVPAATLNEAQTKLLVTNGSFYSLGPVIDGLYLQQPPLLALQEAGAWKVDLLIGSAEQEGVVQRSKAFKKLEASQDRGSSRTAFFQALENSLLGDKLSPFVTEAAAWFYSLEQGSDENSGSANSTRDHFITCPVLNMAWHWAENSRGDTFMYYVPENALQSSAGLDLPEDMLCMFGLPLLPQYQGHYTDEEKGLCLKIMQYIANFVKSGNPNYSSDFSRKASRDLPPWPMFLSHKNGDSFKEFTAALKNGRGLKQRECSFWNTYIPALKRATGVQSQVEQSAESRTASAGGPMSKPLKGDDTYS